MLDRQKLLLPDIKETTFDAFAAMPLLRIQPTSVAQCGTHHYLGNRRTPFGQRGLAAVSLEAVAAPGRCVHVAAVRLGATLTVETKDCLET